MKMYESQTASKGRVTPPMSLRNSKGRFLAGDEASEVGGLKREGIKGPMLGLVARAIEEMMEKEKVKRKEEKVGVEDRSISALDDLVNV
jgi:hypothetical protein